MTIFSNVKNANYRSTSRTSKGITVLEMIMVIIILIILGSILFALLPNMTDSSKQASTVSNLRTIASALSVYRVDNNAYPTASSITELSAILEPGYIAKMVLRDGWGQPFFVDSMTTDYTIGTGGKNWDGSSPLTNEPVGSTYTFESDIILTNGIFIQFPAQAH